MEHRRAYILMALQCLNKRKRTIEDDKVAEYDTRRKKPSEAGNICMI